MTIAPLLLLLPCCPLTEMHILCYYSYTICVHFNVIHPFTPWSSQQSFSPLQVLQATLFVHLSLIYRTQDGVCVSAAAATFVETEMAAWNFGSSFSDDQSTCPYSHKRRNNEALVGIAASQFVGNTKLSL